MMDRISPLKTDGWNDTTYAPGREPLGMGHTLAVWSMYEWTGAIHQFRAEYYAKAWAEMYLYGGDGVELENMSMWDMIWDGFDQYIWNEAKKLERPGQAGRIAREYGLFDPRTKRPSFQFGIGADLTPKEVGPATPAPASSTKEAEVLFLPEVGLTTAQSGRSYLAGNTDTVKAKDKAKTKGKPDPSLVNEPKIDDIEHEDTLDEYPDFLPSNYKLGKKIVKVYLVFFNLHRTVLITRVTIRCSTIFLISRQPRRVQMLPSEVKYDGRTSNVYVTYTTKNKRQSANTSKQGHETSWICCCADRRIVCAV